MKWHNWITGLSVVFLALQAQAAAPDSPEFFETKIRPVLIQYCHECHSGSQIKGELNLEDDAGLRAGGASGEIIVPGKLDESFLWEVLQHTGDLKMPPKEKLPEQELADLSAWIAAGAPWPQSTVTLHLGNLFDDTPETPLLEALQTDAFKADATADDLGIDRIGLGLPGTLEIAPGIKFDFTRVGGYEAGHGGILNDAWGDAGGIRTQGPGFAHNSPRTESGIGIHANAFITFDLFEIRKSGGIPVAQPWKLVIDRMGINDDAHGAGNVHLVVLSGIAKPGNNVILSAHINGQAVPCELRDGVALIEESAVPAPLKGDGRFASLSLDLPPEATFVMLACTAGGPDPADNRISSDHGVFSGARLEFGTTSSVLAQLGRPRPKVEYQISAEQRGFWAFLPIRQPALPEVRRPEWVRNEIDRFILAELEAKGLQPVGEAERIKWIRRASYDLLGLPPHETEVREFLADESPEAHAKVIDRLLASPHYGERWGRYWLDLMRYAEDQAHTFQARNYPHGHRYRDWVVQSLNADKPYDRFLLEQLAGDQLPDADPLQRSIPLGFMALGPVYYMDAGCAAKAAADELDDRVDTLGRGILGLTVACARCHDHKFDPIPQSDYYAIAGIFKSTQYHEAPLVPQAEVEAYQQGQKRVREEDEQLSKYRQTLTIQVQRQLAEQAGQYLLAAWQRAEQNDPAGVPPLGEFLKQADLKNFHFDRWKKFAKGENTPDRTWLAGWKAFAEKYKDRPAAERFTPEITAEAQPLIEQIRQELLAILDVQQNPPGKVEGEAAQQLAQRKEDFKKLFEGDQSLFHIPGDRFEKLLVSDSAAEWERRKAALEQTKKSVPPMYPVAHAVADGQAADMPLYQRGNVNQPGDPVPRAFLRILSPEAPQPFQQGSGRKELAEAIVQQDNPLTARVIANRVWQYHFGRGIVNTPSNFGLLGERPTHPALLDYLASTLRNEGWSLKKLHRHIMLSATYRLATDDHAQNLEADPENRYLWRMTRRRLDVEAWRDTLLVAVGELEPQLGGPSGNLNDANYRRRTLYGSVSRHNLDPLLRLFDFPDPNITSERRPVTTVPLQQLFVLNSDFMVRRAQALSRRLHADGEQTDEARVQRAFWLVYSRPADADEVAMGVEFVNTPAEPDSKLSAWEQYAQALLAANETMYVD